ncbi:hypothetical protein GGI02_004575 [Coemansia sp. RSA 2322]|nr:hypothetical protein GGI02_004575 [Coemansia sp. RSA 2322]
MEDTVHPNELKAWGTEFQALDDNVRHLVAISAMASASRPAPIADIAQRRLSQLEHLSEKTLFVQQTREAILKMTGLMGMPRTIHAMASLMSVIGPDSDLAMEIAKIPTMRNRANYDYEQMRARGQAQFNCVYGSQAMEVHEEVRGLYPELAEVAIVDLYGRLLSENRYLSGRDTELCIIGALVPQNAPVQLNNHCKGAVNLGATKEMVQAALRLAKIACTKKL